MAKNSGAFVVEINPVESAVTPSVDVFLNGPSGKILPQLVAKVKEQTNSSRVDEH